MACFSTTAKYSLLACNTAWSVLGVLLVLFAAIGWSALPPSYAIGIVIMGVVILLTSMVGCCAAVRESPRLLWTFAGTLLLMATFIVLLMILGEEDAFKNHAIEQVESVWQEELQNPGAMERMQTTYACCGRDSAEDYIRLGRLPPASCCRDKNCINPLNLFVAGCLTKVEEDFADEASTTQLYEWCLLGVDLVILLLAIALAIHFTNRKRRFNY